MTPTNSTPQTAKTVFRARLQVLSMHGLGVLMASCLLMAHSALADTAEITWTGATSTGYSTLGNWTSGTTTSLISAVFNATTTPYGNQPALTVAASTAGIWDTDATTLTGVTTTISGAFGLTVTGNATLDGSLTGSAGILLDGAANTTNSLLITTNTLGISNNTNFTVNNGGTLTISGLALNLSGKTLTLGSTTSSGSGSIVIASPFTNSGDLINIDDTAGSTSVTLSGNSTYTGTIILTAGQLNINSSGALGTSSDIFIINGGTIDNTSGAPVTTNNVSEVWGGDFTFIGSNALNTGTSTRSVTLTANRTVTVVSNTLTVQEVIGDSGSGFSLTKAGAGTLVLFGGTYSGGLNINSGTVLATTGSAAGTGTITLGTASGSSAAFVIDSGAVGVTVANPISLASGDTTGTLILGNITTIGQTISGAIALNGDNLTIYENATNTLTLSGSIGGAGNIIAENVSGNGIKLSGTINNTGTITNSGSGSGGSLTFTISGTLGSGVQSLVENSLTSLFVLSGTTPSLANQSFGGNLLVQSGTMEVTGTNADSGTGTITLGSSGSSPAAFLASGTGAVANAQINTAVGATGTLTLGSIANVTVTYGAPVSLSSGDSLTLSTLTGALVLSGGVAGSGNLITAAGSTANITIGTSAVNNIGTITNFGAGTGSGLITAGVGSNVTAITESSASSALTISSTITGTSAISVNVNGTTLTNNNSSGSKLLTVSGTGGVAGTGNLILDNNSAIANGITISTNINNSGTLINSGGGAGSTLISGTIGTNVQAVVQNSTSSTLVLSASNTYTGSTTITAGTLALSVAGSISKSTTIDVGSGAVFDVSGVTSGTYAIGSAQTLQGAGTVNGAVTLNGSVTAVENGVAGQLTFNNSLALTSSAQVAMVLTSTAIYSQIEVGGTTGSLLTYGNGTMTLTVTPGSLSNSTSYALFMLANASTTSGDFGHVYFNSNSTAFTDTAGTWTYTDSVNSQQYTFVDSTGLLTVAAVPEPSPLALGGVSFCLLLGVRYLRGRRIAG